MRKWLTYTRDDIAINNLLEIIYSYQKSRVLLTACELDIFSVIGTDSKLSDEIAFQIDADKSATHKLLDSLCSMNLLEKKNNSYSNTIVSLRFLDKSKPEYISIMGWNNLLWNKWNNLTDCVKKGTTQNFINIQELSGNDLATFIDSIHWRSFLLAPDVVKLIRLDKTFKMLDLGGIGDYALEFVQSKPDLMATIVTYPNIAPFAIENIKEHRATEQINVISGDYMNCDIGSGYDLVFLSFVLSMNTIWENIDLARKAYDSLKHGGKIVIQDYLLNDSRTGPDYNALYPLEMLVSSKSGDALTSSDVWIILKEAWFHKIEKEETEFGTSLVYAEK
jgi:hypothetical protein